MIFKPRSNRDRRICRVKSAVAAVHRREMARVEPPNRPLDIAGEVAVQLWECALVRERLHAQCSGDKVKKLREVIALGRCGWRRP